MYKEIESGGKMSDTQILNWFIEQLQTYEVMTFQDITDVLLKVEEKR